MISQSPMPLSPHGHLGVSGGRHPFLFRHQPSLLLISFCNGQTQFHHVCHPHLLRHIPVMMAILLCVQTGLERKLAPRDTRQANLGLRQRHWSGPWGAGASVAQTQQRQQLDLFVCFSSYKPCCSTAPGNSEGSRLKDGL